VTAEFSLWYRCWSYLSYVTIVTHVFLIFNQYSVKKNMMFTAIWTTGITLMHSFIQQIKKKNRNLLEI